MHIFSSMMEQRVERLKRQTELRRRPSDSHRHSHLVILHLQHPPSLPPPTPPNCIPHISPPDWICKLEFISWSYQLLSHQTRIIDQPNTKRTIEKTNHILHVRCLSADCIVAARRLTHRKDDADMEWIHRDLLGQRHHRRGGYPNRLVNSLAISSTNRSKPSNPIWNPSNRTTWRGVLARRRGWWSTVPLEE